MPLSKIPFTYFHNGIYRPVLQISIINPHTNLFQKTYGIIDTGADDCAVPASFAALLGHNLQEGLMKTIQTGNGETVAYTHTTKFEIFRPNTNKVAYTILDTPIDFMPNLPVVLLGVNSFLSKFVLRIDYPRKVFSIRRPKSSG